MSITGKLVGAIIGLLLFRSPWGASSASILGHFYDQSAVIRAPHRRWRRRARNRRALLHAPLRSHGARRQGRRARVGGGDRRGAQGHGGAAAQRRRRSTPPSRTSRAARARTSTSNHHAGIRRGLRASAGPGARVPRGAGSRARSRAWTCRGRRRSRSRRWPICSMSRASSSRTWRRCCGIAPRAVPGGCATRPAVAGRAGAAAQRHAAQRGLPDSRGGSESRRDDEVAKAYRRQLSKHHPDKLKANGLPDSMLEHAKQRTQQIIEAYELIKSTRGA